MQKNNEVSGLQKAAILLITLGPEKSAMIFSDSSLKMPLKRLALILLIFVWMMRCTRRWLWYIRPRTATGIFPFTVTRERI